MAGAVGIVFGLCVLSFTAGAALMYVVVRRREEPEDEVPQVVPRTEVTSAPPDEHLEIRWHAPEYDVRPIHRNPVVGLPPVPEEPVLEEPALEEAEELEPEPETVLSEPQPEAAPEPVPEPDPGPEQHKPEAVLPPPAVAPAQEQATPPERDEFRQRYLRTFEAARRRAAGSNNYR